MVYFTRFSYMVIKRLSLRELSLGGFLEENENGGKNCRDNVHRRYGPFGSIRDTGSGGKDLDPCLELRNGLGGGRAGWAGGPFAPKMTHRAVRTYWPRWMLTVHAHDLDPAHAHTHENGRTLENEPGSSLKSWKPSSIRADTWVPLWWGACVVPGYFEYPFTTSSNSWATLACCKVGFLSRSRAST